MAQSESCTYLASGQPRALQVSEQGGFFRLCSSEAIGKSIVLA